MAIYNYGYPYGNPYGNPYQPQQPSYMQPNYNNMGNGMPNQTQPQPQQQSQPQTSYLPLTYVSGLIGAKSFIVAPNQTIYLRDSDEGSDLLFQKSADMYGKYTIKAYRLTEVNIDDIGKPIEQVPKVESLTKNDLGNFATKNDLNEFKSLFESKMNDLSALIQKGSQMYKNNRNIKDGDKNE